MDTSKIIRLLFIIAIIILTSCSQTPYDNTIMEYYNTDICSTGISNGVHYKLIRDYQPITFRQLNPIPAPSDGVKFKHKPDVAVEHKYKCTLVFILGDLVIPNCVETDTIYLYKANDGKYKFCKTYFYK